MNDDSQLFKPTLNKQGYAMVNLDPFSEQFTQYADGQFLEIGAAYGFTTLKALENGNCIVANDLEPRHLEELNATAKDRGFTKLKTIAAEFPSGLNFEQQSFRKILICRVLHFFKGKDIKEALKLAHDWLKIGGELYVVCETTYLTNWAKFIPEYERRKARNYPFPGEIDDPENWENTWSYNLPEFVHWLDIEPLRSLFEEVGFEVIKANYIDRAGQFPDSILLDGRESVGIIGKRVK